MAGFPSGITGLRPTLPGRVVRRARTLTPESRPLVNTGDVVGANQPIAEITKDGMTLPMVAGLAGRVITITPGKEIVIEGAARIFPATLGIGEQVAAPLAFLPQGESLALVPIPAGAIIVYPNRVPLTLMQRALTGGAAGIIGASAFAKELGAFARVDLTTLLDSLPTGVPTAPLEIILTEGLGEAAMPNSVYEQFLRNAGNFALLNCETQPRKNIRPEVLLSAPAPNEATIQPPVTSALVPGAYVAVAAGRQRGARGRIVTLSRHQQRAESGALLDSAVVELDDGHRALFPLAALEGQSE